jgi:hypothetical protein
MVPLSGRSNLARWYLSVSTFYSLWENVDFLKLFFTEMQDFFRKKKIGRSSLIPDIIKTNNETHADDQIVEITILT